MKSLLTYITEASSTKYIKLLQKFIDVEFQTGSSRYLSPDTIIPYGTGGIQDLKIVGEEHDTVIYKGKTTQNDIRGLIGMTTLRGKVYMVLRVYGGSYHRTKGDDEDSVSFISNSERKLTLGDTFILVDIENGWYASKIKSETPGWYDNIRFFEYTDPNDSFYGSHTHENNHLYIDAHSIYIYTFFHHDEREDWVYGKAIDVDEARSLFEELAAANIELYTINVKAYEKLQGPGDFAQERHKTQMEELRPLLINTKIYTKELHAWYDELMEKIDWYNREEIGITFDDESISKLSDAIDEIEGYMKPVNKEIMLFRQGKIDYVPSSTLNKLKSALARIPYFCGQIVSNKLSNRKIIDVVGREWMSDEASKIHQAATEPFILKQTKTIKDAPSFRMENDCKTLRELLGVLYKFEDAYKRYLKSN